MAKVSKYKQLIGKVINDVMVVDYERQERVSKKSGKTYKVTRLYVTADGENMLEIGTASFNKMSFIKRLAKITTKWIYKEQPVSEPVKYELMPFSYLWFRLKTEFDSELEKDIYELEHIDDIKQAKAKWRELSKKYHPDCGGNAKDFQAIRYAYEEHKRDLEIIEEAMKACGLYNEQVSESVNSLTDFKNIYDLKELKKAYRRLSKIFHPDMGGNAQTFKQMHINYKKRKYAIKSTTELFEECPEFSEFTTFEEEVDDAMINTNWDGVFEKGEF